MTLGPKSKIAMGVAAALGVLALGVTLVAHSRAQGAQSDASGDASSFPGLLFAASPTPSQIATGGSTMGDGTTGLLPAANSSLDSIAAALSAALAQITANKDTIYNTNAAQLFSQLPTTLANSSIEDFLADFGGFDVHAHVVYRSSATPTDSAPSPSPSSVGTNANLGGVGSIGGASVATGSGGAGSGFAGFSAGLSDSGLDFGAPDFGGGDFGGATDSGGGSSDAGGGTAEGGGSSGAADGGGGDGGGGDGGGE